MDWHRWWKTWGGSPLQRVSQLQGDLDTFHLDESNLFDKSAWRGPLTGLALADVQAELATLHAKLGVLKRRGGK